MKPSAVLPQGANFSLLGRFGNCPLVACMTGPRDSGGRRRVILPPAYAGAITTACGLGCVVPLGLGAGLDDLLLDERKVTRQGAGA